MFLKDFIIFHDSLRKPVISSKRKFGIYPYYGAQGIVDFVDDFIFDGKFVLLAEDGNNLSLQNEDISRIAHGKFWVNNHAHVLTTNKDMILEYLNYFLNSIDITPYITGSAQPKLNKENVSKIKIEPHSYEEQQHIVNILGSIDDKIENNEKIITKIDNLAALFYKKECNKESDIVSLGEYIENYDKERKPLSSRERDLLKKIYPYYGATEVVDYVDNYLFDGDYVLLGEDGTVIDAQGFPIIQRVNGKFWANNHTHILQGVNNIDNNILEVVLKNTNVKSIITGAVQLKINQSNMNKLKIILPANIHF